MKSFYLSILFCVSFSLFAQNEQLKKRFDSIEKYYPTINKTVRIDVSDLDIRDLIQTLSEKNQLNVSIDQKINQRITTSFYNISIKDIFRFLIQKHNLDIDFINKIIYFYPKKKNKTQQKKLKISLNKSNNTLNLDLKNDSIQKVAKLLTDLSNQNIILSPKVKQKKISIYIRNQPFEKVLKMIAESNKLSIIKKDDGYYYIDEYKQPNKKKTTKQNNGRKNHVTRKANLRIQSNKDGTLYVEATDADILDIIKEAAYKSGNNFILYSKPTGINKTIKVDSISFEKLLTNLFSGENFIFQKNSNYYIIGKKENKELKKTELIRLENRTIEGVVKSIPKNLSDDVEIKEFKELNAIVITGTHSKIDKIKTYLNKIDQVVPLIQIEVLIVQFKKSHDVRTGLSALLSDTPVNTSGNVFPQTNMTYSSTSINKLIESLKGFGVINIGKVAKNFYVNLQALENNSVIDLKSTPKIATLNGHEASVSIGQTSYYFEQTNKLINSGINQNILQTGQWKSTNASLTVNIKPFVSSDDNVTLEITVEKSSFLERAGENAPPGKITQKFNALIRVKNDEMVLLGGLDEISRGNSGSGTPVLSRIPIIKWFFSSRNQNKSKSKLGIFIKPTISY